MKKLVSIFLAVSLVLTLAACGGKNDAPAKEAPDLNQYYEDFMSTLGEDNTPAMVDVEGDFLTAFYPGLENIPAKQSVLKMAMISSVAFEFALVEVENESDAKAAADIFQARIDAQAGGGAMYPMTVESWEKAKVITHGNVVALICAADEQDQAVEAFNKLFS